jgi:hypothetical protein
MLFEPLDNATRGKVPQDELCIVARGGDEPVAFADINVGDEVLVAVERSLQSEAISVPDFNDSEQVLIWLGV